MSSAAPLPTQRLAIQRLRFQFNYPTLSGAHLFQLLLLLLVLPQHSSHCGSILRQLLLHISQLLVQLQHGCASAAALRF